MSDPHAIPMASVSNGLYRNMHTNVSRFCGALAALLCSSCSVFFFFLLFTIQSFGHKRRTTNLGITIVKGKQGAVSKLYKPLLVWLVKNTTSPASSTFWPEVCGWKKGYMCSQHWDRQKHISAGIQSCVCVCVCTRVCYLSMSPLLTLSLLLGCSHYNDAYILSPVGA